MYFSPGEQMGVAFSLCVGIFVVISAGVLGAAIVVGRRIVASKRSTARRIMLVGFVGILGIAPSIVLSLAVFILLWWLYVQLA